MDGEGDLALRCVERNLDDPADGDEARAAVFL
jgi:hypothetical protein